MAETLGAETISKYINVTDAISRLATSEGIDPKGLVRNEQDIQAEMQATNGAAQQQQLGQAGINVAAQKLLVTFQLKISPKALQQLQEQIGQ